MEEMFLLDEHSCYAMMNQNIIFINKRWHNNKERWFLTTEVNGHYITNEIKYCPYCGEELGSEKNTIHNKDYEPICKFGYDDCISDPNYIKHYYNEWWHKLGCPTDCDECVDGSWYDDEDK